jgi:hypothetical protein
VAEDEILSSMVPAGTDINALRNRAGNNVITAVLSVARQIGAVTANSGAGSAPSARPPVIPGGTSGPDNHGAKVAVKGLRARKRVPANAAKRKFVLPLPEHARKAEEAARAATAIPNRRPLFPENKPATEQPQLPSASAYASQTTGIRGRSVPSSAEQTLSADQRSRSASGHTNHPSAEGFGAVPGWQVAVSMTPNTVRPASRTVSRGSYNTSRTSISHLRTLSSPVSSDHEGLPPGDARSSTEPSDRKESSRSRALSPPAAEHKEDCEDQYDEDFEADDNAGEQPSQLTNTDALSDHSDADAEQNDDQDASEYIAETLAERADLKRHFDSMLERCAEVCPGSLITLVLSSRSDNQEVLDQLIHDAPTAYLTLLRLQFYYCKVHECDNDLAAAGCIGPYPGGDLQAALELRLT